MIEYTVKRITRQLEILTKSDIAMDRALDLLEATTQELEEIVVINTLRESLSELPLSGVFPQQDIAILAELALDPTESIQYIA